MAIKITKAGQKEFHGFCKWCGCEFIYEISDLKLSATGDKLDCPTCGKDYHHPSMNKPGPTPITTPVLPDISWPYDSTDPCAGCVWRENLLRDGLYIGDTPCTWCNKNRFNTIIGIADNISVKDYMTPCINDLNVQFTTSTSSELSGTKYTTASNNTEDITQGAVMQTILNACGCSCGNTEGKATKTAIEATQANDNHACCSSKKNCRGKH